jgi:hypothetical protein
MQLDLLYPTAPQAKGSCMLRCMEKHKPDSTAVELAAAILAATLQAPCMAAPFMCAFQRTFRPRHSAQSATFNDSSTNQQRSAASTLCLLNLLSKVPAVVVLQATLTAACILHVPLHKAKPHFSDNMRLKCTSTLRANTKMAPPPRRTVTFIAELQ